MRIISGQFKGRRISAPKKLPVRPTTDMAKEALFNILNNQYYFDDISVLDLFSGTGSISYEFASRGTKMITAVDEDFGCIKFINKTAEEFEMDIRTIKSDVFKFLEKSSGQIRWDRINNATLRWDPENPKTPSKYLERTTYDVKPVKIMHFRRFAFNLNCTHRFCDLKIHP